MIKEWSLRKELILGIQAKKASFFLDLINNRRSIVSFFLRDTLAEGKVIEVMENEPIKISIPSKEIAVFLKNK